MARIERADSTQPIPVEQAQLISPSEFRFSTAEARAWGGIGDVLSELGRRKIDMQDRIGISDANALMRNAEREYLLKIEEAPLDEHAAIRQKYINDARATAGKLRMSQQARELSDAKFEIWADTFDDTGELANIRAVERVATIRVMDDYGQAIIESGGDLTNPNFLEAEKALDEHFKSAFEPPEAKVMKRKAHETAIKQLEENAINDVYAAIEAASDPETGTRNFAIARELANNPLIPESRQASLRSAISSAEKAAITANDAQLKELQERTAIELSGRVAEARTPQDAVSLMTDIDNAIANQTLDRKVGEGYKRELVKGREVPTDWNVYNKLVLDIEAVRDGKKDFIDVFNEIQTHRGQDLNGSQIDALTASTRTAKSIAENELPPVQANQLKRHQRILTAYFNADMFGKRDKKNLAESSAKYADKAALLDQFSAKNPEATIKEYEDFFRTLTEDAAEEGFLGRLWKYLGTVEPLTFGLQIASGIQRQTLKEYSSPPIPLPKPTNQAEYDLITIGQEYIHPDGTKKVKQ